MSNMSNLNQIKLNQLPETVIEIIKDKITTAHARNIYYSANEHNTLCCIAIPLLKEGICYVFLFGKRIQDNNFKMDNLLTIFQESLEKHLIQQSGNINYLPEEVIPRLVDNKLIGFNMQLNFSFTGDKWTWVNNNGQQQVKQPSIPETPNMPNTPNAFKPFKPCNKIITQSSQPVETLVTLAGMLGLTLVYEEDNKLVFNKNPALVQELHHLQDLRHQTVLNQGKPNQARDPWQQTWQQSQYVQQQIPYQAYMLSPPVTLVIELVSENKSK